MLVGSDYVSELWPPTGAIIPQMIYEYGESQWNDIGGKTKELGEKSVPLPLWPLQMPRGLTGAQTWASMVSGRRLTA
jgi:hypothetical protein